MRCGPHIVRGVPAPSVSPRSHPLAPGEGHTPLLRDLPVATGRAAYRIACRHRRRAAKHCHAPLCSARLARQEGCASRAPWQCASRAPSRRRGTALHAAQQLSKTLRPAAERCAQVLCSGALAHAQALATPWLLLRLTLAQSLRHCCCASAARLVACVTTEGITMFSSPHAAAARPTTRRWLLAAAALAFGLAAAGAAQAQDTIKVGILHSLSGTMAISETTLKDVVLMLIDEQNKKGGVLGKKLEAVVVDPASNWPLFAEKARERISKDKVAAVFGCWTSVSRKSVLPVFKELNSILFYPVQYEGEESERNVFYTGAAPNQQAIPAVDYLAKEEKVQRWVLEGTDYVYPRTTNKILEAYLKSKGVADADISINYTPFGHADWQTRVAAIKQFGSAGKKTAVVSTINGDANVPFYKELGNQGIKAKDIPSVAFSVGEEELAGIDTKPLIGHLAAWNYFESINAPINKEFIAKWHAFTKNPKRVTNDPMEAHVIGFAMWIEAVKKAGTTAPDKVIDALPGIKAPNLSGGTSEMLPNHHITKPVFIGEVRGDGQFDVVWKTPGLVPGDAWSKQLPGSKDLIGDWV